MTDPAVMVVDEAGAGVIGGVISRVIGHQGEADHLVQAIAPILDTHASRPSRHPRVLWVGIGCKGGTPRAVIESGVRQVLAERQLTMAAIAGVATLDWKANEEGLLAFCQAWQLPLQCFAAAQLRTVTVPTPSAIIDAEVGSPSVAEAAALYAAMPRSLIHPPTLLVPKQIYRLPNHPGVVTLAVAQAERE